MKLAFILAASCTGPLALALACIPSSSRAENPVVTNIYTADPSAHVFDNRMYLYPSHDRDDSKTWDMTDWHVFSSTDLVSWTDHGVVLDIKDIPFAKKYAWAPDCAHKNGKYYFYFPVSFENPKNTDRVGVAVGDSPSGPFKCQPAPLVTGYPDAFDPCAFIDDDGSAYLVVGQRQLSIAKLKDSMVELAEELKPIQGVSRFFEGAWMHKYKGKYYISYSTGSDISYAMGDSPYGPFEFKGTLLREMPHRANTTHHSIVEYRGQWYIFYHNAKLADDRKAEKPNFKRSSCIDLLNYNADGTIAPVQPTIDGIKPVQSSIRRPETPQGCTP